MILLHHQEVELSRNLLATMPEDAEAIEGDGGHSVSAYPSVVVDVPAYGVDQAQYGEDGEFLGMVRATVPASQELLRMPASWAAVQSYQEFVENRARMNPAP